MGDASQFQHSSGEAAMSLSRECMVALGCGSVECVRKSSAENLVTKCNMMVNAGKFIPTVGAIFTGYDGDVLQRPLLSDLCSGTVAANADVPLLVGSSLHEWRFFQGATWANYSAEYVMDKFLTESVPKFATASVDEKECVRQEILKLYKDASALSNCSACGAWAGKADMVQFTTDIEMTIGAQLQAQAVGGKRYRYLFDIEAGHCPEGSAHGWELYFFTADPASLDQSNGFLAEQKQILGRQLREYWTSFARDGVPSNFNEGSVHWEEVGSSLGAPLMRLRLAVAGGPIMQQKSWFSDTAAQLVQDLACGQGSHQFVDCFQTWSETALV